MTNNDLITLDNDIMQMNSAHVYFNRGKIENFYRKYFNILKLLKNQAGSIQEQFFVLENGKLKIEGEGSDKKYVMREGKTMDEYVKAFNEWGVKEIPKG